MTDTDQIHMATDELRGAFPSLSRQIAGKPIAYLDGAAGAQVPQVVIDEMARYLSGSNGGQGGRFANSVETDVIYGHAREAGADFLGSDPDEIGFGPNMTTLNFLLAHAVARTLSPGDEIITTNLEHDGNVSPWLRVAEDHDLTIHVAPFQEDTTLDMDALSRMVGKRTRIIAFTLASNALGTKTPAREIADVAHSVGALAWGDAVHMAPHARVNRKALGLDVVLCSPYKFCGPHLGMVAIERSLAEQLPADRVRPASETPAGHRFETGTLSHEAIAGFVATIEYLAGLGRGTSRNEQLDRAYERIRAHEEALSVHALERLAEIKGLRVYGITDPERVAERTPTFSFTLENCPPKVISQKLGDQGIFTWNGNFYALNASVAFGVEEHGGFVRAGFLHYTTREEVDRLCDAVQELAG